MNRTKVTVACQACQKKKVKCTGVAPCTNCNRTGHQCEFTGTAKKRGPRNGTVEVIKSSASRIENVLEKDPSLRPQIEQMMKRSSSARSSRSPYVIPTNTIMIIDDDPTRMMDTSRSRYHSIPNSPGNYSYSNLRGHYSHQKHAQMNLYSYARDDVSMELQPSREIRQDVSIINQSPAIMRPVPKYPLNMRNHATNGCSDDQFSTNSSHNIVIPQSLPPITTLEPSPIVKCSSVQSNIPLKPLPDMLSDVSRSRQTNTNPLPPLSQSLGEDSIKLPIPWMVQQPKKSMSMPIFGNSAGIQLLLSPAPDLGNPLDNNRQFVPQFYTEYEIHNHPIKTSPPTMTLPSPSSSPEYTPKSNNNDWLITPKSSPPSSPSQHWYKSEVNRVNFERSANMDVDRVYQGHHHQLLLRT